MTKIETENSKEQQEMLIKNAIWTCEAFHFSADYALQYINSGLLGYTKNREGNYKMKDGQRLPITISRASYFRYKKLFTHITQIYQDLSYMALQGYVRLMVGFQVELATLHRLSAENLLALKNPLERQQIISSMVKDVIPTQCAFADMLKKMMVTHLLKIPNEENNKPENITD